MTTSLTLILFEKNQLIKKWKHRCAALFLFELNVWLKNVPVSANKLCPYLAVLFSPFLFISLKILRKKTCHFQPKLTELKRSIPNKIMLFNLQKRFKFTFQVLLYITIFNLVLLNVANLFNIRTSVDLFKHIC